MAVRLNNREYKPDAQASGSSAQCRNLSQTKRKNVVQWAVEPLARASGLYWGHLVWAGLRLEATTTWLSRTAVMENQARLFSFSGTLPLTAERLLDSRSQRRSSRCGRLRDRKVPNRPDCSSV